MAIGSTIGSWIKAHSQITGHYKILSYFDFITNLLSTIDDEIIKYYTRLYNDTFFLLIQSHYKNIRNQYLWLLMNGYNIIFTFVF